MLVLFTKHDGFWRWVSRWQQLPLLRSRDRRSGQVCVPSVPRVRILLLQPAALATALSTTIPAAAITAATATAQLSAALAASASAMPTTKLAAPALAPASSAELTAATLATTCAGCFDDARAALG